MTYFLLFDKNIVTDNRNERIKVKKWVSAAGWSMSAVLEVCP